MTRILVRLCRPRPAALVALSSLVGYLCTGQHSLTAMTSLSAGVFLLAVAATIINQIQERDLDARMRRTENRPLPAGQISPAAAAGFSLVLGFGSLFLLWSVGHVIAVATGLLCLLFYNLVYTPLKRVTSLAVFAGAPCGALPPVIGWVCGGGSLFEPGIWSLAALLLLWQIPHTLLFVLHHRDDFRRAGLPLFAASLSPEQTRVLLQLWLLAVAAVTVTLPLTGQVKSLPGVALFTLLAPILTISGWRMLARSDWRSGFVLLNLFLLLTLGCLVFDQVLHFQPL
ncbi:MAG: protoheme IX farnesyltransferase [Desulfuromonas sp.]|nr:MAG: protoheme IX farnesyltransferase [Desulfuromonas sp.]